jgi:hypothetical protein
MVEMALKSLSEKNVVDLDDERRADGVEPDGGAVLGRDTQRSQYGDAHLSVR